MILANVREGLTPTDMDLVVRLLSDGDAAREARYRGRLAERGRDALLEEPSLFPLMCRAPGIAAPSAPLFIYVAVRHALRRVGIDDSELGDYLSALLLEFGARDRAHRISPADDQVYRYVSDIVADLDLVADHRRAFLLRAHLGNFSLWLAGVFPDYIAARRERHGGPDLGYYEEMGARGFRLASDHQLAKEWDLTELYHRAAESFERLRVGLNRLSDLVFFRNYSSPDRLMRQVSDTFRFGLADN
ncbi:MAG: hypothetical protein HY560_04440 [Gemmatimonadetes bacterium]|nr:hypothetical protein [Gemmatimonadota bacterium]